MTRLERFWDRRANEYDRNQKQYERTYGETVENTRRYLNVGDVVLNYACGIGIITNAIAEDVKEVHALDISSKMIDVAQRAAGERGIENVHYAQATIFDDRYQTESFNVILAFHILHLLEDAQRVMQRINNLLKPGGLFISATACLGEKSFLGMFLLLLSKTGIAPHMNAFKLSELAGLITNGSFRIVETAKVHRTPPNYFIVAEKMGNQG